MYKTKERNILLVYQDQSTFVKHDFDLLSKYYSVEGYYIEVNKKLFPFLIGHLKLALYLLMNFRKIDLIYTWFGDYHAFTAGLMGKLLGIPQLIVVGGNDAVSIPSLNYGVFVKNSLRSKLIKRAYKMAKAILVVDASLIQSENNYASNDNIVGLENFVPGIKNKCYVVPTGYDPQKWKCQNDSKKEQVLSVAIVDSDNRAKLKGFDLFINLAKNFPHYQFVFIGVIKNKNSFDYHSLENLQVIDKVKQEELKAYYCESKLYLQLSISEGLPNALCEAMLCEAIPMGSNVSGIPNCIGDTGFILNHKDINEASTLLEKAMNAKPGLREMARERIIELFPENKRELELKNIIDSLD